MQWLDTCGRNGITQNHDKFVFGKDTVEFAGFEISLTSVKPCSKVLQAIKDFPTPRNVTDIRSWFGLVNQLDYAFAVADYMRPFRDLLNPDHSFAWTEHFDYLFRKSKMVIIDQIKQGVEIFDQTRPTCIATDWSQEGLVYWLPQKHCDCADARPFCCKSGWKVVLLGSRFTHGAESRYASIEGEALAIVDALNKTRHFTLGCPHLTVVVYHKPLLKVMGDRALDDIPNPRLRNIKEKSLRYRFRVLHIHGVRNTVADALSRNPVGDAEIPDLSDDVAATQRTTTRPLNEILAALRSRDDPIPRRCTQICTSTAKALIKSITWNDVHITTASDSDMSALVDAIHNGFPDMPSAMFSTIRMYHQNRDKLTEYDGVILYKDIIVIPPTLRSGVLQALDSAHQGVLMMVSRAEGSFFWPGMTPAIEETCARCAACNRMAPSQPNAPSTPPIRPVYPLQAICADYFSYSGHHYLGVKTVKRMLVGSTGPGGSLNTDAFQRAMLAYRNTPDPVSKVSLAEIIFGRRIRDFIPAPPGQYLPHWTWRETLEAREDALRFRHMRAHERMSEHTRVLPLLVIGNCVRLHNLVGPHPTKWDRTGIVVEVRQFDQYVVRMDGSRRVTRRNRKYLRLYTPHIAH